LRTVYCPLYYIWQVDSKPRLRANCVALFQILCVDEATASVDQETDAVLQTTLKQVFASRTVLTIAHRIATVIDTSDRVMVMDVGGHLAEFAPPSELLSDPSSLLSALARGISCLGPTL